jgi:hypothetical protein
MVRSQWGLAAAEADGISSTMVVISLSLILVLFGNCDTTNQHRYQHRNPSGFSFNLPLGK